MDEARLTHRLSRYIGSDCVFLTSSGTEAIIKSLHALNLPPDAEIIVPSFCCRAAPDAIIAAGFKPVFCDVSLRNYNIRVEDIEKVLTKKTAAVIVVHLFGQPAPIDEIIAYARQKAIFVIEDAAQSFGGVYKNGVKLGTLGDIGIVSFGYEKIIDAGGGGAIFTNRQDIASELKMRSERYRGNKKWMERLDYLMDSIADNLSIRRENAILYREHLDVDSITHPEYINGFGTFFRYSCILNNDCRSRLIEELKEDGEVISTHYLQPLHTIYDNFGGDCKNSDFISYRIINLFVRSPYTAEYIIKISDKINGILENIKLQYG